MQQPPFEAIALPDDILLLRFNVVSRQAVDLFVEAIAATDAPQMSHIQRVLVDSRVGTQPIKYTFMKVREVFSMSQQFEPTSEGLDVAIVLGDSLFITVCKTFLRSLSLRNVEFRFFAKDEYDQALEWLASREIPATV